MATVAELIRGSLRVLGVLASSETPTAAEEQDGLKALNAMMDSWAAERLVLYATSRESRTLTPGLSPHTIGSGGTFNATRPVRVERASIIPASAAGTELPLSILSDGDWQATQAKDSQGTPRALWVDNSYSLMRLYLWPIPSAADSLVLYTWLQLGRFASTSTDFDLPPGYERAIKFNLAKEVSPEYGMHLSPEALGIADESKAALKRLNHRPSYLRCDSAVLASGAAFNLTTGD